MNDNYAVINGKRIELTDEQVEAISAEIVEMKINPFNRMGLGSYYYVPHYDGTARTFTEDNSTSANYAYRNCSYFNDKDFAKQVALHQLLYRKLLKFAYDNECEDNQEWNKTNWHYYIAYNTDEGRFYADVTGTFKHHDVWFCSKKSAECAIREVVKPFMKEHPEFVW